MAREFSRTERVGQQIHKEIASILQNEFKNRDPRLGMVTVAGVDVSRDLAHAKVHVTFYDNDQALQKEYLSILTDNKGFIRTLLAKSMRMRSVPALKFVQDTSLEEGIRISTLVNDTIRKDEQRAQDAGRNLDDERSEDE